MILNALIIFLLTFLASASPLSRRNDAGAAIEIINVIDKFLNEITAETEKFHAPDVTQASNILIKYEDLLSTMEKHTGEIKGFKTMVARDAANILEPVGVMMQDLHLLVNTLISRKPDFESLGLTSVVQETFVKGKKAAQMLVKELMAKLPANVEDIGEGITNQVVNVLEKGIKTFS
jgi:hypothetical protein